MLWCDQIMTSPNKTYWVDLQTYEIAQCSQIIWRFQLTRQGITPGITDHLHRLCASACVGSWHGTALAIMMTSSCDVRHWESVRLGSHIFHEINTFRLHTLFILHIAPQELHSTGGRVVMGSSGHYYTLVYDTNDQNENGIAPSSAASSEHVHVCMYVFHHYPPGTVLPMPIVHAALAWLSTSPSHCDNTIYTMTCCEL